MTDEQVKLGTANGTPFYLSKTMIAAGLTMAAPYLPYVRDWVQADPEFSLTFAGVVFGILRLVTTGKVNWFKKF